MQHPKTWILIADAGRARVVESLGVGRGVLPVDGLASESSLPGSTHEIVADRQGRSFESSSATRHPLTPKTDPREEMKRDYLKMLADQLNKKLQDKAFDRLVVVAPPAALGMLRAAFSPQVAGTIHAEIAKDLTKVPDHDLAPHLKDDVAM